MDNQYPNDAPVPPEERQPLDGHIPPGPPPGYRPQPNTIAFADTPCMTYILIGICVAVYIGQMLLPTPGGVDWLTLYGAKINDLILQGQVWRLLTPMLLHGSILHLGVNMYALYILGRFLEPAYGRWRFLLLFIVSGFAGNVISFWMSKSASVGASTSIFGLLAAQAVLIYQNRSLLRNARGLLMNIGMVLLFNLALGLTPRIDLWGHVGGLLGGFAYAWSAGPLWHLDLSSMRLENSRSNTRAVVVAIAVFTLFAIVAALKFIL